MHVVELDCKPINRPPYLFVIHLAELRIFELIVSPSTRLNIQGGETQVTTEISVPRNLESIHAISKELFRVDEHSRCAVHLKQGPYEENLPFSLEECLSFNVLQGNMHLIKQRLEKIQEEETIKEDNNSIEG